jgi:hypothetical protein
MPRAETNRAAVGAVAAVHPQPARDAIADGHVHEYH